MTLPPDISTAHSDQPPRHIAIIMDGNGRWAEQRGRERAHGHLKGARVAKTIIETCARIGVRHLTLYGFSTENWLRPRPEVAFLMKLLGRHLKRERATLIRNQIRFTTIGDLSRLPASVADEARRSMRETAHCQGMHLTAALSYGSRQELANAARALCEKVASGEMQPAEVDESAIAKMLETADVPDPDLIIRTGGECRLSNFLLWQAAYSELYVSDGLWPDFNDGELDKALAFYASRERRFGRTRAQAQTLSASAQTLNSAAAGGPSSAGAFGRALDILHAFGK